MANTFGTNALGVLTFKVLKSLGIQVPMITNYSHNMSGARVPYGQTITSQTAGDPAVLDYNEATGYEGTAATDMAAVDRPLVINQWKHTRISISDAEYNKADPKAMSALLDHYAHRAAYKLGTQMVDDGLTLLTAANFAGVNDAPPTAAKDTDWDQISDFIAKMQEAGVPGPYYGLGNARLAQGLRGDATIQASQSNDSENSVITQGFIPAMVGARMDAYAGLSENGAEKVIGFLGHKDALQFGARLPMDAADAIDGVPKNAMIQDFTDPATGLSIQLRVWYTPGSGKLNIVYTLMYGWALGNPALLYRFVRA